MYVMANPDNFDRQFRRTARSMRRRPSARTWDRIENQLDGRRQSARFLGIRPWLIAAVVLIVAGFAAVVNISDRHAYDPLAQRAESMEELDSDNGHINRIPNYLPISEGRPDGQLLSPTESRSRLIAAPKYRL